MESFQIHSGLSVCKSKGLEVMDKQRKEDQERRRRTSLSSVKGRYKKNAAAEEELQGNECDRVRGTSKDRAYI